MELFEASRQYFSRPDDQRFLTEIDLLEKVKNRREHSREVLSSNKALRVIPYDDRIVVDTVEGEVEPTNWSFRQLVDLSQGTSSGIKWLKPSGVAKIHPQMSALAINYGLNFLADAGENNLLIDTQEDQFRAINTTTYGRIWDEDVVRSVMEVNVDGRWKVPVALDGSHSLRSTTLYASDRDVFMFLVDPVNEIEIRNPTTMQTEVLYRGFMVCNSEVGKAAFWIMTFLYRRVCDNRIVWGAEHVRKLSIRHTQNGPDRFRDQGVDMLREYAEASAQEEKHKIEKSMELVVGNSEKDVKTWLMKQSFGASEAQSIIKTAKAEEGDFRTVWQLVQGATAEARSINHTDTRVHMERRAGNLLDKVA